MTGFMPRNELGLFINYSQQLCTIYLCSIYTSSWLTDWWEDLSWLNYCLSHRLARAQRRIESSPYHIIIKRKKVCRSVIAEDKTNKSSCLCCACVYCKCVCIWLRTLTTKCVVTRLGWSEFGHYECENHAWWNLAQRQRNTCVSTALGVTSTSETLPAYQYHKGVK